MTGPLVKVDDRGRVAILKHLRTFGHEAPDYYVFGASPEGVVFLTPANITTTKETA